MRVTMVGAPGGWSFLILVVCCGRPSKCNKLETLCPKPAVAKGTILVALHSRHHLTCPGCEGHVSWRRPRGDTGILTNVTEGGHLVLERVTHADEDKYTCYKDGAPVCNVTLMLEEVVSHFSCHLQHLTHNITCEGRPTRTLRTYPNITLIHERSSVLSSSPCTYVGRTFSCSAEYNEGDSGQHIFYLCVSGRSGSRIAANLRTSIREMLRVGPPRHVQVAPVKNNPKKLNVTWRHPDFWENPFYKLKYQVLYRAEDFPISSNGTTEETSYIINDAIMGSRHLIRVRAQEEYLGDWGNWSEEAVGVPWSDTDTTSLVPPEYDITTSEETTDLKDSDVTPGPKIRGLSPRVYWIAPCVSLALFVLFVFAVWMRYQEVKILKLKWCFLRSFLRPSSKSSPVQAVVSESLLMAPSSSPSSVAVTVPPVHDGE